MTGRMNDGNSKQKLRAGILLYTSGACQIGAPSPTITATPANTSSSPTPAWSTCYSSADLAVRVFGDFVSATAKTSASAYCSGITNLKPTQPPHMYWPRGCAVPNPGGLPAMPDSEIEFNVNKDLGGFCTEVSYAECSFQS